MEKRNVFYREKPIQRFLYFCSSPGCIYSCLGFFTGGFSVGKIWAILLYRKEQVQEIAIWKDPQGTFFRTSSGSLVLITWLSQWDILCIHNNSIPCKCKDNSDRHLRQTVYQKQPTRKAHNRQDCPSGSCCGLKETQKFFRVFCTILLF